MFISYTIISHNTLSIQKYPSIIHQIYLLTIYRESQIISSFYNFILS